VIGTLFNLARPLIHRMDAETAHRLTVAALAAAPPLRPAADDPVLATEAFGLSFSNPVGLAAGFDKHAEAVDGALGLGFGFVEVGGVTPLPQPGNPKPRLFRLAEDRAVINRLGFNNRGQGAALTRLGRRDRRAGIVGVNLGANKDSADRIIDYVAGVAAMTGVADYLTINISSPNTPGLRALQDEGALDALLEAVIETRGVGPPVFLKVAPDLDPAQIDGIAEAAIDRRLDGLIVGNTTISRPMLVSKPRKEAGGLSGAPLKPLALQRLKDFRKATGGALPLIAAGGIENGVDAFDRIRAGASLVQLYTALVYQGPGLAEEINGELKRLLKLHGFASIAEAIGTG
jgi:dihydroorotate dehydrogenase